MRRVGQARRRDANESGIVDALEAAGARVTRVSGKGAPDLIVRPRGFQRGHGIGLEVKSAKGKQTEAQQETDWPIVRSVDEALKAIGAV